MVLSHERTPRAVLIDLARTNTTVFPGMPVFYQVFCEMENIPALPKLRLCISAGAPLALGVGRQFQDKFNSPIHSFYGASECGGSCYDRNAFPAAPGLVGQPRTVVDLQSTDPMPPGS